MQWMWSMARSRLWQPSFALRYHSPGGSVVTVPCHRSPWSPHRRSSCSTRYTYHGLISFRSCSGSCVSALKWVTTIFMAALCNRGPLYFCPVVSFYLLSIYLLSFFPRLISAAAGWMSAILWHMVWPWCEFRMQVWKVLHAARCKCRTQKVAKNRHLGTIPQLCRAISSQLRHVSTIGKKLIKQQYLLYMFTQYGELRPTSGWDRFISLGHPR